MQFLLSTLTVYVNLVQLCKRDLWLLFAIVVGMHCMCLNVLNLSGNNVTHLPAELHTMSSLHTLAVDGNPLVCPPTNVSTVLSLHLHTHTHLTALFPGLLG